MVHLPSCSQIGASLLLTFLRIINPPGGRAATSPRPDAPAPPPSAPPPHISCRWWSFFLRSHAGLQEDEVHRAEVNDTQASGLRGRGERAPSPPLLLPPLQLHKERGWLFLRLFEVGPLHLPPPGACGGSWPLGGGVELGVPKDRSRQPPTEWRKGRLGFLEPPSFTFTP